MDIIATKHTETGWRYIVRRSTGFDLIERDSEYRIVPKGCRRFADKEAAIAAL